MTPIVAFSGPSGVGKTRLLRRLVAELTRRGLAVGYVKHTGHDHPLDRRGKDTEVIRRAGALATAIEGPAGMAFFGPPRRSARALADLMPSADLILAEGWRREPLPRVEVHRRAVSTEFLCARDPRVFAVVTDEPPPRSLPAFGAGDVAALADLLCARLRVRTRNVAEAGGKGPAHRFRRSPEPGAAAERRPRRGRAARARARRREGKTGPRQRR